MSSAWRALLSAVQGTEFEELAQDAVAEIRPAWMVANTLRDRVQLAERQHALTQELNTKIVQRMNDMADCNNRLAFENHMQKKMIAKILITMRDAGAEDVLTLEQRNILDELTRRT